MSEEKYIIDRSMITDDELSREYFQAMDNIHNSVTSTYEELYTDTGSPVRRSDRVAERFDDLIAFIQAEKDMLIETIR